MWRVNIINTINNMTAIVAVLNKHAVAIAADSAVTMGDTHKVVNSANKIFTLSKYHPVAVMTYNNAAFMGVPWDIIIKEYRRKLKDKSFNTIKEYAEDFIKFIRKRNFFCEKETQLTYLKIELGTFVDMCLNDISRQKGIKKEDVAEEDLRKFLCDCKDNLIKWEKCPEFESYSYDKFRSQFYTIVEEISKENNLSLSDDLCETFFYYLSAQFNLRMYTGLVFVGYGEKEIYPSLHQMNMALAISGHLRYYYEKEVNISDNLAANISPFAQTDVTDTILRGINPAFQQIINDNVGNYLSSFSEGIANILDQDKATSEVASAIRQEFNIKESTEALVKRINDAMFQGYTKPLIDTVISLDKEDMANMAESFISLTSLVRRMQPGEETVGGPVDVAVISKGDGFVWINRKHYFKPELNAAFFQNYLRK